MLVVSYIFSIGAIPRASFLIPLVRKAIVASVPSIFMTIPLPNVGCVMESPGRRVSDVRGFSESVR